MHLNMMPQRFSVRRPILMVNGPKQSTPVDQKGGLYSLKRDASLPSLVLQALLSIFGMFHSCTGVS